MKFLKPIDGIISNATKLETPRKINGVDFDGTSDITITLGDSATDVLTKLKTVDGASSGLDSDLLDGQHGSYYLDWANTTNKPDPVITLSGDATGSVTLTDLASGNLAVTVADDSHNHIISNVDGLQTALDGKIPMSGKGDGSFQVGRTFFNVASFEVNTTPIEIVIKTRIPYSSGSQMPTIHLAGYAYGLAAPIELKIAYYIYGGNYVNLGAVSLGAWKPEIKMFSYLDGTDRFVAVALIGSIYYPRFSINLFDMWQGTTRDHSQGWTVTYTTADTIVGTDNLATVPYKSTFSQTISLTGDVSGSATFDGASNTSITAVVADDSHNHIITNVDGLQAALDSKVDDAQVLTNVPVGAKFTDTVTTINGKTGAIAKADVVALGIPAQDTVYTHPTGTNPHNTTKADVGLGSVDNTADNVKAVLSATKLTTERTINGVAFDGTANITVADSTKEPSFIKNTGFNKAFGTIAGTVTQGNDSRLSDARTPLAHNHIIGNVDGLQTALDGKVDDSQVLTNVPAGAKFTDTVYVHPTTAGNVHIPTGGASGQFLKWSSAGTATWAEDNNTVYALPVASAALGGVKSGTDITVDVSGNVSVNDDSHNHIISNVDGLQTALDGKSATGHGHTASDVTDFDTEVSNNTTVASNTSARHTHSNSAVLNATTASFTAADETKLDGIAVNANNYSHPTGDGNLHVPATSTSNSGKVLKAGATAGSLVWGDDNNTVYSDATTSVSGLMSNTDKTKLNGIASGAEVNVNSDWNASSGDAAILNKPSLGTASSKNVGASSGNVPVLDSNGKLDVGVLPAIAISDTFVVATQTAMLAVVAEVGDIAVRTDLNQSFILKSSPASTLSNWQELLTPSNTVTSVAGKTGAVTLVKGDVGLGNVDNESKATMFSSPSFTGTPLTTTAAVGTNTTQVATTAFVNSEIANDATPISHVGSTGTAHGVATTLINGFMSSTDKTKLDGVATGANNYALPVASTNLGGVKSGTDITVDASGNVSVVDDSHNHIISNVDGLQTALDGKVDDAQVLTNVPAGAVFTDTVYTHPASHAASMITGLPTSLPANGGTATTLTGLTATITELNYTDGVTSNIQTQLDGKVDDSQVLTNVPAGAKFTDTVYTHPTTAGNIHIPAAGAAGQFLKWSSAGVATWAADNDTVYAHPANHPASVITQDASNRFVTDAEKVTWNAKGTSNLALGITSATAYRGDYGNTAYAHSQVAHAPSTAQVNQTLTSGNGMAAWTATSGNLTVGLGTPTALTATSTNAVTATSHTHSITTTSVGAANTIAQTDASGNLTAANTYKYGATAYTQYNATTKSIDFIFV